MAKYQININGEKNAEADTDGKLFIIVGKLVKENSFQTLTVWKEVGSGKRKVILSLKK